MRILLKSLDSLKSLLKLIKTRNRQNLDDWFYNASDEDLRQALVLMNSQESLQLYPKSQLREYVKFAKDLLNGQLRDPPSDSDLLSEKQVNIFNYVKGSFIILSTLKGVQKVISRLAFKRMTILGLTQTKVQPTFALLQVTRPIASLCRILMSRVFVSLKSNFSAICRFKTGKRSGYYLTELQKQKLKLSCVREMIKKGKINLEQRAFWIWSIVVEESLFGRLSSVKDDYVLLRQVAHSSNLRYFQGLKEYFDRWKSETPMTMQSLLSISPDTMHRPSKKSYLKYRFKKKLKNKLNPLVKLFQNPLSHAFKQLDRYAEYIAQVYEVNLKLAVCKPHIRNLIHVHSKLLKDAVTQWKSQKYEYTYEEMVVTISKEVKNFKVCNKPVVLLDYHEDSKQSKVLARNLFHILFRKLKNYWNVWARSEKVELNYSTEVTIDISLFKLSKGRYEKLKVLVLELLNIGEARKNLSSVFMTRWIQNSTSRLVAVSKLAVALQSQLTNKQGQSRGFLALKSNIRNQSDFTDIF